MTSPRAAPRLATALVVALAALSSCRYGLEELFWRPWPVDERVVDAGAVPPPAPAVAAPATYAFVVISDPHFTADPYPVPAVSLAAFLAAQPAEFVVVGGDVADAGLPGEYDRYTAWTALLGVPVITAAGNHDLYNGGWSTFRTAIGASFFSFAIGGRSFYVLDTGSGTLGRDQLRLLRAAFAADPNPKVVITHYPLYNDGDSPYFRLTNAAERAALVDLYATSGVGLLLEGHTHALHHVTIGPVEEWVCPSLAGPSGGGRCLVVTVSGGAIVSVAPATF